MNKQPGIRHARLLQIGGVAALFLAALIIYSPVFHAGYIFDDNYLIRYNPAIRSLTNVPAFFVSKEARVMKEINDLQSDTYRPLQSVSYALSYHFWGDNPGPYHVENILLHAVNGGLLFFLLLRLLTNWPAAFIGALLFVVHPAQVEAVAYLSERSDLLAATFFLLSFITFTRCGGGNAWRQKGGWLLASLGFYASALLAKEMAITLPAILLLYLLLMKERQKRFGAWRSMALGLAPYAVIAALFLSIRTWNLGKLSQTAGRDAASLWLTIVRVFGEYASLLFFPFRLSFFHEVNSAAPKADLAFYASLGSLILALWITWFYWGRNRKVAFFLGSFFIALLPVSNIIPIKTYMQERFLYLPLLFVVAPLAMALTRLWVVPEPTPANAPKRLKQARHDKNRACADARKPLPVQRPAAGASSGTIQGARRWFGFGVCGVIVILFGVTTARRAANWSDEKSLLRSELAMHPKNAVLYYDLGYQYFWETNYDVALPYLRHAAESAETAMMKSRALDVIGDLQRNRGFYEEAIKSYKRAVELTPSYVYSLASLGVVYCNLGDYAKAAGYLAKAVEIWPDCANYNANLGIAYFRSGDKEKALSYWKRALAIAPAYPLPEEYRAMLDGTGR